MFDAGMRVSLGAPEGRGVSHCLGCLACGRAWGFPIAWAGGHRRAWGFPIAWVTTLLLLFFNNVGQKGVGFPHCLGDLSAEGRGVFPLPGPSETDLHFKFVF